MHIVIAGGTGFIGRHLCERLREQGHHVMVLTRYRAAAERCFGGSTPMVEWDAATAGPWEAALRGAQAIVNLSGAPIGNARWTDSRKRLLSESRVNPTRTLVRAVARLPVKPAVFINASGSGFYGPQDDRVLDESSPAGAGFLADLCLHWEAAAQEVAAQDVRTLYLRTGMVLGADGGALPRMALPFRLFLGGPIMPGSQWVSWIHLDDVVGLIEWSIATSSLSGPVNAVAPEPVRMQEFCRTLGKVLHRPSWFPVPRRVLSLALGELSSIMTTGQRVKPGKAEQGGYRFAYSSLDAALKSIFAAKQLGG